MAQTYDKKYGINSTDSNVEAFHRQRTMFVIKDNKLYVAESGLDYSHAIWFEKMGWMTADNDQMMDHVTRGYVDRSGVYAYVGYDFRTSPTVESEIKFHFQNLLNIVGISSKHPLFCGLIRNLEGQWQALKTIPL